MVSNHNHERFFSSFGIKTKKSRVSQSILLVLGTCQMYLKLNSSVGLTAVLRGKPSTLAPQPWCGAEALLEPGELGCSCTALLCGAVPRSGEMELGRARPDCVPCGSCLGTCRTTPEVKQDLGIARQYDT